MVLVLLFANVASQFPVAVFLNWCVSLQMIWRLSVVHSEYDDAICRLRCFGIVMFCFRFTAGSGDICRYCFCVWLSFAND